MSLYGDKTYENLLNDALSRVSSALDKRESSLVYNANAPSMAELAQLYIGLDFVFEATYLSTAPRDYLILRAADRGMQPTQASPAKFRAEFSIEVQPGERFSQEGLNFAVTGRLLGQDTETGLAHEVTCETPGTIANGYTGRLIPINYIDGLTRAELVQLLIPGEDVEETEAFRQRVLNSLRSQAFGGNIEDYVDKIRGIDGVTAAKVHPVWNGDIAPSSFVPNATVQSWYTGYINTGIDAEVKSWLQAIYTAAVNRYLTVGGTVKVVIMSSEPTADLTALIDVVQTVVDPVQNTGEGLGLAPIGHVVNVTGVVPVTVNVALSISYKFGYDWGTAQDAIKAAIDAYFAELIHMWAETDALVVRVSQLESRILSDCAALIADITSTTLNGVANNLTLGEDSVPVRGTVSG